MFKKLSLIVVMFVLMTTNIAFATPSNSTTVEILGLIDGVILGMDNSEVTEIVQTTYPDVKIYSDGVAFDNTVCGFDNTTVFYLWPKGKEMNQIVLSFPYDENGPMFNDIERILHEKYGAPVATMAQGNLFIPTSDYEWSVTIDGDTHESETSTGKTETKVTDASEYLIKYNDSSLLIIATNTEFTVYMNMFGSPHNIGGDDKVELIYTILSDEDAQTIVDTGYAFSSPQQQVTTDANEEASNSFTITENDITYMIEAGNATVISYTGSAKTVRIPSAISDSSVTSITGFGKGYEDLSSIIIPASVKSVDVTAFRAFQNVSFTVDSENDVLASIDGSLFEKKSKTLLFGKSGSLTVPEGIVEIGPNACRDRKFGSIIIPDTVNTIGERAFENSHISSITFGSGVTTIKADAFNKAGISRSALSLPDSVVTIGDRAFKNFGVISDISLGSHLEWIGDEAFAGLDIVGTVIDYWPCTHSSCREDYSKKFSISLPDSLKHLGQRAFADIKWVHGEGSGGYCSITNKFTPSDGQFHYYSFSGTLNITINADTLEGIIPDGVFDQNAGAYQGWNDYGISDPKFYVNVSLKGDKTVLNIGANAFRKASSVSLPVGSTLATIGNSAFENTKLQSELNFSPKCTVLHESVFHNCSGIVLSAIPSSITRIESLALATSEIKECELGEHIEEIARDAFNENVQFTVFNGTYAEQWVIDNDKKYQYAGDGESDNSWLNN